MAKGINLAIFKHFFDSTKNSSLLLLGGVIFSLILANSAFSSTFESILTTKIDLSVANFNLDFSISAWINDGLMAIFFLLVGLEIKRELIEGELSSVKKASLPVFAALGGMLVPALIYMAFNAGKSTASGWGIPMATDIAFALAIVGALGNRIPLSLKIFLAALAIVDDLGAILVIAIFYSNDLHWDAMGIAAAITAGLFLLNYLGVKKIIYYLIPGIFLWYFVHHAGIHATIAGVILAFSIPTNPVKEASPLEKLEHSLAIPVNFLIMPIFALANTNIVIKSELFQVFGDALGLGIMGGLLVGKTIGVTFFSWLAVKLKIAKLPKGVNWNHILGMGMLAGIGFTMSIFISMLSFSNPLYIAEAKFAILCASIIAAILGYLYLTSLNKRSSGSTNKASTKTNP
ncbi:MAG: Na+/H+ antiporter NhaA [Pedobacter sp.]|nr:MAG: Na+/H+ antiporter NhaA [Pedobacter sp.]